MRPLSKLSTAEVHDILLNHRHWLDGIGGKQANLEGQELCHFDLKKANLSKAKLARCSFYGADLRKAKFEGAGLVGANFVQADLRSVRFDGANLRSANLRQAKCQFTRFNGANLTEVELYGANIRQADFSQSIGLLDPTEWLAANFLCDHKGIFVYKAIGNTDFKLPRSWVIESGRVLTEIVNPDRTIDCACGVNFATEHWCQDNYKFSTLWQCHIAWRDFAGIIVPYTTNGKARCSRLTLLRRIGIDNV